MNFQNHTQGRRVCKLVLFFFFFVSLIPSTAEASIMESRLSSGEQMSERAEKIESIKGALEHKMVAQRLKDHGLSPEEVEARLHTMDDEQLHQMASLSDEIGGSGLGIAISVLVIVVLVIVILKLTDREVVVQ